MFSLEKGKNIQGILSVGVALSIFLTWYTVIADIGIMYVDADFSAIALAINSPIYWLIIICALATLAFTFYEEQSGSKNIVLGVISLINLVINLIAKNFMMPGAFDSETHFGYYIFLACTIAHIIIGYKSKKNETSIDTPCKE